ncbi:hypothetical protein QTP88_016724 [Uroleucon formosanum]
MVRTICGKARYELCTGSYRAFVAGHVGVRRRRLLCDDAKVVVFRPYDQNVAMLVKSCTRDRIGRSSLVITLGVSSDLQSSMFIGIRLKKNCGMKLLSLPNLTSISTSIRTD